MCRSISAAKSLHDCPSIPGDPFADFTFRNASFKQSSCNSLSYKLYQTLCFNLGRFLLRLFCRTFLIYVSGFFNPLSRLLSVAGNLRSSSQVYSDGSSFRLEPFSKGYHPIRARLVRRLVPKRILFCSFQDFKINFPPSQIAGAFGLPQSLHTRMQVIPVFSSTPLPGFIGGNFITTTGSSATLQSIIPFLSFLLAGRYHFKTLPGFPG